MGKMTAGDKVENARAEVTRGDGARATQGSERDG